MESLLRTPSWPMQHWIYSRSCTQAKKKSQQEAEEEHQPNPDL
jgi:hypothetical protein